MNKQAQPHHKPKLVYGPTWIALDPLEIDRIGKDSDEARERCDALWKLAKKAQK